MSELERIAYKELRPGDVIQPGDEWQNPDGRWHPLVLTPEASMELRDGVRARRPYKSSTILEIGDALANAQKAAAQLQDDCEHARKERDAARASEARLSTELWARKPLEDRVASLTGEAAQLRLEKLEWMNRYNAEVANALQVPEQLTAAKDALKSAQRARDELQLQVDELRVDRDRLQGLIDDLVDEPTAQQVQDMLRTWATELDWAAGCFDSAGRDKVSAVQRVLVVAIQRIGSMIDPEDTSAND